MPLAQWTVAVPANPRLAPLQSTQLALGLPPRTPHQSPLSHSSNEFLSTEQDRGPPLPQSGESRVSPGNDYTQHLRLQSLSHRGYRAHSNVYSLNHHGRRKCRRDVHHRAYLCAPDDESLAARCPYGVFQSAQLASSPVNVPL